MREIHRERGVAHANVDTFRLVMRKLQQLVEQAELVHHFERRRVYRVAAKVAQKIGVLFENDHLDARAREQKAEHEPGRAAACNADLRGTKGRHRSTSPREALK